MRTLALIGGMTYNATSNYYNTINKLIQEKVGGSACASLLLHSFNNAEMLKLFAARDWSAVTARFVSAATHMKAGGADGLVICCNIAHTVADEVEKQTGMPLLHIADYTGVLVQNTGIAKVALLGTKSVMNEQFLRQRLEQKYGLTIVVPSTDRQDSLQTLISETLSAGVFDQDGTRLLMNTIQETLDQGAKGIILACTELQFLINPEDLSVPVWDTGAAHAVGAVEWALDDK